MAAAAPSTTTATDAASGIVRAFPQPFGRYMLLHPLAQGGMGAVFLAKYAGAAAAFERMCVIKTVRRALTEEPEALPRFFDELKIVAQLNHRNICSIFDAGAVDGRCYFAMDHVAGVDLQALADRCQKNGAPIHPAIAVHIVGEVLEALAYAHRLVDGVTGRPLGIVHRDISPHNVLVSFEGEVKLIDFGLVLSRLKTNKTEPHVVVGKVSYMSPEHASGDPVDARTDQYSIAVVATELFTGAAFYADVATQQAMWAKAAMGGHRPAGFDKLDPQLRAILDKALQVAPADRFASCEEFRDALDAWAVKNQLFATPHMLRALTHRQFGAEAEERRLLLASFADVPAVLPSAATAPTAAVITAGLAHAPPMVASSSSMRQPTPQPAVITPQMLHAGAAAMGAAPPMPPAPPPAAAPAVASAVAPAVASGAAPAFAAPAVAAPAVAAPGFVAPSTLVEAPPLVVGSEMPKRDTQPMDRPRIGSTTDESPPPLVRGSSNDAAPVVVDAAVVARLHAEKAPRVITSPGVALGAGAGTVSAAGVAAVERAAHQRATAPPDIEAAMRALPQAATGATEVVARQKASTLAPPTPLTSLTSPPSPATSPTSPSPFAKTNKTAALDETAPFAPVQLSPAEAHLREVTAELPAKRSRGPIVAAVVVVLLLLAVAALLWSGVIPGFKLR